MRATGEASDNPFYYPTKVAMRCKDCGAEQVQQGREYIDSGYVGPVESLRLPQPEREDE